MTTTKTTRTEQVLGQREYDRCTAHEVTCHSCGNEGATIGARPTSCGSCGSTDLFVQSYRDASEAQRAIEALAPVTDEDLRLVAQAVRNGCYPMAGDWHLFVFRQAEASCACCGRVLLVLDAHLRGVNDEDEWQTYCRCGGTWDEFYCPSMDGYEVDAGVVHQHDEVL